MGHLTVSQKGYHTYICTCATKINSFGARHYKKPLTDQGHRKVFCLGCACEEWFCYEMKQADLRIRNAFRFEGPEIYVVEGVESELLTDSGSL